MSDRSAELEGRLVKSLEELGEQRASFDRVSARLGEDGFVAAWSREGADEQIDLKGSLERAYEQIVNDLHSMLELVEKEAHACGLVPDPQLARRGAAGDARQAWWKAAEALGIDVSQSDQIQAPGRWRRLALYGHSITSSPRCSLPGATRAMRCSTPTPSEMLLADVRSGHRFRHFGCA